MEKGSKFLAFLVPVSSELEAQAFLQTLKKSNPKARHFCSALRIGPEGSLERSNDDGEPSGSAGKPILGQLVKHKLTNVFAVVVRYFGGTKLGIPGLIDAYKTSVADAISHANIIQRTIYTAFKIEMSYEQFPSFKNHVIKAEFPIFKESFDDQAILTIGFRKSFARNDLMALLNSYSGRDFETLEDYSQYLTIELTELTEAIIA